MVALAPSRLTGRMSHLLQGGVARPPPLAASGGTLQRVSVERSEGRCSGAAAVHPGADPCVYVDRVSSSVMKRILLFKLWLAISKSLAAFLGPRSRPQIPRMSPVVPVRFRTETPAKSWPQSFGFLPACLRENRLKQTLLYGKLPPVACGVPILGQVIPAADTFASKALPQRQLRSVWFASNCRGGIGVTHFLVEFVLLAAWFLGISAVLFAAFLAFEFVQHRKTYRSDNWSEEALLQDRIDSGTLPLPTHVMAAESAALFKQEERYLKQVPVRRVPFVHKVVR